MAESYPLAHFPTAERDQVLRHGFMLSDLNRLARAAVVRDVFHRSVPFAERLELAFSAIAEHLYASEQAPTSSRLIRVAWNAMRAQVEDDWHTHGVARSNVFEEATGVNFWRYWNVYTRHRSPIDERVVERQALWQIWQALDPRWQQILGALAEHGDYGRAAQALGMERRQTYITYVSCARRAFLELWHEGEIPSKPWGHDRARGNGRDSVTYTLRRKRPSK